MIVIADKPVKREEAAKVASIPDENPAIAEDKPKRGKKAKTAEE